MVIYTSNISGSIISKTPLFAKGVFFVYDKFINRIAKNKFTRFIKCERI